MPCLGAQAGVSTQHKMSLEIFINPTPRSGHCGNALGFSKGRNKTFIHYKPEGSTRKPMAVGKWL